MSLLIMSKHSQRPTQTASANRYQRSALLQMTPRSAGQLASFFLIVQFVLLWTTFFILSSAINWPASLDDPASVALPRMLEKYGSIMTGYSLYLIVAILLVPATAALNIRFGIRSVLGQVTLALSIISAVAKTMGITRWLFGMPVLARAYATPGANRDLIELLFTTLNEYAGGIGEIVGVALITGIWTLLMGAVLARSRGRLATVAGSFVMLMGCSLFLTIPAGFGIDVGPMLTISNVGWQFGMLVLAFMTLLNH